MNRPATWACAVALTLALSAWQRISGPTYAVRGTVTVAGQSIGYRLERSFAGPGDAPVRIVAPTLSATRSYRPAASAIPWTTVEMTRRDDSLIADLPHQPMAGKLDYFVTLRSPTQTTILPAVTIRFRGAVPPAILVPHIL